MFKTKATFSSFSTNDIEKTKKFYSETLGVKVEEEKEMGLNVHLPNGHEVFIYPKPDHVPATFTVLNFVVDNIDEVVDELVSKDVTFERYDNMPAKPDAKGIFRGKDAQMGPNIAWFKDPAGNILSVIEN